MLGMTGAGWQTVAAVARDHGFDPFRVGARWDVEAVGDLVETRINACLRGEGHRDMLGAVSGAKGEFADGVRARLDGQGAVTAELMASIGVDPLAWTLLDALSAVMPDIKDVELLQSVTRHSSGETTVQRDGITWHASGALRMRAPSETVAQGIAGRLLSDYLSHPVFDRHRLRIAESRVVQVAALRVHIIEFDAQLETVGVEGLDEAWRRYARSVRPRGGPHRGAAGLDGRAEP